MWSASHLAPQVSEVGPGLAAVPRVTRAARAARPSRCTTLGDMRRYAACESSIIHVYMHVASTMQRLVAGPDTDKIRGEPAERLVVLHTQLILLAVL